jgi:pectate lyase
MTIRTLSTIGLLTSLLQACSGDDGSSANADSTGGAGRSTAALGGSGPGATESNPTSKGGATASSSVGLGGASTSGGATSALGGASTSGGATSALGGATTTKGGASAAGGATAIGGTSTMGGTSAAGGASAIGGTSATGGTSNTGGTTAKGGTSATGGTSSACPLDLVGFATLDGGTIGGGNATPTVVTTQAELRACATATEARVCKVKGTLTFSPFEEIRVASNKTIIGVGNTAEIVMGGFFLNVGVNNVIIRNLTIRDSYIEGQYDTGGDNGGDRDGIQMDTAHHVWIDHNRFSHLGDGQIDSRKDTTYVTTSWNILENHNKAYGIGWTENVTAQMTIHHNVIRNTTQRNPSTDNVLRAHLFNNFMQNISSYGNYSRNATNMVLENSVFDTVNDPHYYDTGTLVALGNVYRSTTGQKESSGSTYSVFNPHDYYSYTLDATNQLEAILAKCAGPRAELGN